MSKGYRDNQEISATVLVEAKKEYTEQLTNFLSPQIYKGLQTIWKNCKIEVERKTKESEAESDAKPVKPALISFQEKMEMIPIWSDEIITKEYSRIIDDSKCDYYDDLITAVFISHVKVLSSVRLGKREKQIELKVPNSKNFIHKCYIEAARKFYENPFLMEDRQDKIGYLDIQRNLQASKMTINGCVKEAIQKLLPTRDILQSYLEEDPESDNESYGSHGSFHRSETTEDITKDVSEDRQNVIKDLVKQELEHYMSDHRSDNVLDHDLENVSSKPFRNVNSSRPDLDISGDEAGIEELQRDRDSDSERSKHNDSDSDGHSSDSDSGVVPIPIGEDIETESTKQVIVPASKKLQQQKEAEQNLIPEIKKQMEENPNIGSDTLFLSDSDSDSE